MAIYTAGHAVVLTLILVCISIFDARFQRIPNALTLVLLCGGLAFQFARGVESGVSQMAFGAGVLVLFVVVRHAHRILTGVVGLGLGDAKMAAAGAVWFSPKMFPLFLFISSVSAIAFALMSFGGERSMRLRRIPFGPFLAIGVSIAFWMENLQ